MKEKEPHVGEPMKTLAMQKECKNIYQRMSDVMQEVQYIQKIDKAAKGLPYKFISHDQVTGALHMPLVKNGIVVLTNIEEFSQDGNRTCVKAKVSFVNIDDPKDRIEVFSYGYGIDTQDKGPGKAISYATKMAYLKCFMLETGEDPEKANEDYKPELIAISEILELEEYLKELPGEEKKLLEWCQIKSLSDMPREKFKACKAALHKKLNKGGN